MVIKHYDTKFKKKLNPKVGLIALSTDQTIERDFKIICNILKLTAFLIILMLYLFLGKLCLTISIID